MAVQAWKTRKLKFTDVNRAVYNPRKKLKPGMKDYEALRRSIEEFGLVEPLVFNEQTGTLVGGHQRLSILEDLGEDKADMVVVDLPPDREKILNIALNKISGEWHREALGDLLRDLEAGPEDVTLTGFTGSELERLLLEATEEETEYVFSEELHENHQYVVLYFDNEIDWQTATDVFGLDTVAAWDTRPGYERKGRGRIVRGAEFVRKLATS